MWAGGVNWRKKDGRSRGLGIRMLTKVEREGRKKGWSEM